MPKLTVLKDNRITRGCAARYADLVYLSLVDKALDKKGVAHTRICSIDADEIGNCGDLTWRAATACVVKKPAEKLVVLGGAGKVYTYVGGTETTEQIPGAHDLRGSATIDGKAWACGMGRQVFRRDGEKKWADVSAPGTGKDVYGFEAIAGHSAKDVVAVGWNGEIWRYDGKKWAEDRSGVDVILTAVCAADDGVYFAAGQGGVLLKSTAKGWSRLDTGLSEDLTALAWFENRLFVATWRGLFTLEGDTLSAVRFGKKSPQTFGALTHADGVLWSLGPQSVFSWDGKTWLERA